MSHTARKLLTFLFCISVVAGCVVHIETNDAYVSAKYEDTRHMSVPHETGSGLLVTTQNGSVNIKPDKSATDVQFEARIKCISQERLNDTKVIATRSGGKLNVQVDWPGGRPKDNESCSFDITVPDANGVEVQSTNGEISITGLGGTAVARSSNGAITISDHDGTVDARSTNGRILLTNNNGSVKAHTSNGGLEIQRARREVEARTTNGRVNVELTSDSPGPVTATTTNGSVEVAIGPGFSGELQLGTTNGSINVGEFNNAKLISINKNSARLRFGDSSAESEIRTTNGSVKVRPAS